MANEISTQISLNIKTALGARLDRSEVKKIEMFEMQNLGLPVMYL